MTLFRHLARTILLAITCMALSGCLLTAYVTDKANEPKTTTTEYKPCGNYEEAIKNYYITQDGQYIAIITDQYHYIMKTPEDLAALLNSPLKGKIRAEISNAEVRESAGMAFARIKLFIDGEVDTEQKNRLFQYKFERSQNKTAISYSKSYALNGTRYQAKPLDSQNNISQFNQQYTLNINLVCEKTSTSGGNKALLLLTPITVAADGVLILFEIPLLIWMLTH